MKLTAPHWAIVALTVFALVEPEIAQAVPAAVQPYLGMAFKVDSLVLGYLGVTTASAVSSTNAKAMAAKVAGAVLGLMLLVGVTAGCGHAVFPTLQAIEQTVASDLAAGKTDQQIASDVCADLGGTATTDAVCADAVTLTQDAISILLDSGALQEPALTNAKKYKAAHSGMVKP